MDDFHVVSQYQVEKRQEESITAPSAALFSLDAPAPFSFTAAQLLTLFVLFCFFHCPLVLSNAHGGRRRYRLLWETLL